MNEDIKKNVTRRSIWLRLGFMIVMSMAFSVAGFVTSAVIAFQFLASLFIGQTNAQLTRFGRNMARYLQQITVYMTFATEEKPFPFTPWPDEPHEAAPVVDEPQEEAPVYEEPQEETPVEEDNNQLDDKSEKAGNTTEYDEAGKAKKADDSEATDNSEDADTLKD